MTPVLLLTLLYPVITGIVIMFVILPMIRRNEGRDLVNIIGIGISIVSFLLGLYVWKMGDYFTLSAIGGSLLIMFLPPMRYFYLVSHFS